MGIKPRGRPPTKDRYGEERRALAVLIGDALKNGRSALPDRRSGMPWHDAEFAKAVGTGPSCVIAWRTREDLARSATGCAHRWKGRSSNAAKRDSFVAAFLPF